MNKSVRVEAQQAPDFSTMTEEELSRYEQALPPTAESTSPLQVLWESYQGTNEEMILADPQNNLYSVSVAPDGLNILIYPIKVIQQPDYSAGDLVGPAADGKPNWNAVSQKYFPGGYTELPRTATMKTASGDFWMRTLAKVLSGYSRKDEILSNPYLRPSSK